MGRVCERETSTGNHGAVTPMNATLLMVNLRLLCVGIGLYGFTLGVVVLSRWLGGSIREPFKVAIFRTRYNAPRTLGVTGRISPFRLIKR